MLISLALNLMQEQVLEKVHWFSSYIGMSGDNTADEEVVKITKEDRLKQTAPDMTGNELDFNEKRRKSTFAAAAAVDGDDEDEDYDEERAMSPIDEEEQAGGDEDDKDEDEAACNDNEAFVGDDDDAKELEAIGAVP